jgi:hypothetical protein
LQGKIIEKQNCNRLHFKEVVTGRLKSYHHTFFFSSNQGGVLK